MCPYKEDYFKAYFKTNEIDFKKSDMLLKTLISTKTSKNVFQKLALNIDNKTISDDCIIGNHLQQHFYINSRYITQKDCCKFYSEEDKEIAVKHLSVGEAGIFPKNVTKKAMPEQVLNVLKAFNLNKANGPNSINT